MNARTPLVDLVPRGNAFYVRLFAGGAAIVALLEVLYAVMPLLASRTTDGRVAAVDLDAEGSLAVWVLSFTLLVAAAVALVVGVLQPVAARSYRRLWLWAAVC